MIVGDKFFIKPDADGLKDQIVLDEFFMRSDIPNKFKKYLIQQTFFVSDLAMTRNFLWKNFFELKEMYPANSVFKFCFKQSFPKDMRAAFC